MQKPNYKPIQQASHCYKDFVKSSKLHLLWSHLVDRHSQLVQFSWVQMGQPLYFGSRSVVILLFMSASHAERTMQSYWLAPAELGDYVWARRSAARPCSLCQLFRATQATPCCSHNEGLTALEYCLKVALHETYTPFFKAKFVIKDNMETPTYYIFSESWISEFYYGTIF